MKKSRKIFLKDKDESAEAMMLISVVYSSNNNVICFRSQGNIYSK
jgi:hypothetical protein